MPYSMPPMTKEEIAAARLCIQEVGEKTGANIMCAIIVRDGVMEFVAIGRSKQDAHDAKRMTDICREAIGAKYGLEQVSQSN